MDPQQVVYSVGPPPLPAYHVQQVVQQKVDEEQAQLRETIVAEQSDLRRGYLCANFIGGFFACTALVCLIVAFATPEWVIYNVTYPLDPLTMNQTTAIDNNYICTLDATQTCSMFFTRRRGLFYTYYNNPNFFPLAYSPDMYFGNNLWELGYALAGTPFNQKTICSYDTNNQTFSTTTARTSLLRAHWISFVLGIILLFFSCILSFASYFKGENCLANTASALCFFGFLMALIGMACFHGYIYVEDSLLTCPPFIAFLSKPSLFRLKNSTTMAYSYSMYLGWISVATALFGTIGLCVFSCYRIEASSKLSRAKNRLFSINKHAERERVLREKEAKRIAAERVRLAKHDASDRLHHIQSATAQNQMVLNQRKLDEDRHALALEEQRLMKLKYLLNSSPPPSPGPVAKQPYLMPPQSYQPTFPPTFQSSYMPPQQYNDPMDPYTLHLPTGGASPPPYF